MPLLILPKEAQGDFFLVLKHPHPNAQLENRVLMLFQQAGRLLSKVCRTKQLKPDICDGWDVSGCSFSFFHFGSFPLPFPEGRKNKEMGRGRKRRGRFLTSLSCATFSFPCLLVSVFIISLALWKRGIWCKLMLGLRNSVTLQGAVYLPWGRRSVRLFSYSTRELHFE